MISIHPKTLEDLELQQVLLQVHAHAITNIGKQQVLEIIPFSDELELSVSLKHTNEYLSSFDNENTIPNHYFDDIFDIIDCEFVPKPAIQSYKKLVEKHKITSIKELRDRQDELLNDLQKIPLPI